MCSSAWEVEGRRLTLAMQGFFVPSKEAGRRLIG